MLVKYFLDWLQEVGRPTINVGGIVQWVEVLGWVERRKEVESQCSLLSAFCLIFSEASGVKILPSHRPHRDGL